MISVQEVVVDPDMIAPRPYTILRSTGQFVPGGFLSTETPIPMFGPVQQANLKEVQMLAEADRVGSIRSFWSTQQIFETRGYAPVPGVHGEAPSGSGTIYTLSEAPPAESLCIYVNGLLLRPGVDYTIAGNVIMFVVAPVSSPYVTWQITVNVQAAASDKIVYEDETFRILQVYYDPGGGYWKALGTRLAAS